MLSKSAIIISSIMISGLFTITGCATNNTGDQKLRVVASFYPMYYFASQIGGDYATVTNLTPAGVEPHDYDLTAQDVAAIQTSQLLIINGGRFEPWAEDVISELPNSVTVITAGDQLIENSTTMTDPHIWLSPTLAAQEVQAIAQGFIQADPSHAEEYQKNELTLIHTLDELDRQYQTGLTHCATRDIITAHSAFGYLAREYHLQQLSIAGLSPDAEPSAAQLAAVADFARQHTVYYIFFESLVSPKLSETIASEIGVQTLVLNPLEGLSDAELQSGQDYFAVMQTNLANLRTALQCQ